MADIERWTEDELARVLGNADRIDAEGFGATAGTLRELVYEVRRQRRDSRGAVEALRVLYDNCAALANDDEPDVEAAVRLAESLPPSRHAGGR